MRLNEIYRTNVLLSNFYLHLSKQIAQVFTHKLSMADCVVNNS